MSEDSFFDEMISDCSVDTADLLSLSDHEDIDGKPPSPEEVEAGSAATSPEDVEAGSVVTSPARVESIGLRSPGNGKTSQSSTLGKK